MRWNWQQENWPEFIWDKAAIQPYEDQFLNQSGFLQGIAQHISHSDQMQLSIDIMTGEALGSSQIEGEFLNRDSVQSSIQRNFGLKPLANRSSAAEAGIAEMMVDLYKNYNDPLSHDIVYEWHKMLMNGRRDLDQIGAYRKHNDAMQVISGADYKAKVHFEAPPSDQIFEEMTKFIRWYYHNQNIPALTRAAITHLYFVCIHPFEDGNGRIGRALAAKSLAQSLKRPSLIAISQTILDKRKAYYQALEDNNKDLEITDWIVYFAKTILEAQENSQKLFEFVIHKTKFYDHYKSQLNERQHKVIERIFKEGIKGFEGGLSAENYIKISNTSRPTATRDLKDLVNKNIFTKTGELKGTRYWLYLDNIKK